MITDYYSVLSRAIDALENNTPEIRNAVYERARVMVADRLARSQQSLSQEQLHAEEIAFDDAVRRIEEEFASGQRYQTPPQEPAAPDEAKAAPDVAASRPFSRRVLLPAAFIALIVGIFGVGYIAAINGLSTPGKKEPAPAAAIPQKTKTQPVALAEDPDPGYDGGSSYAGLPFYYRRQPVYYRTDHPYHTIIIDKAQHFLYLVQSKTVALRYGVALGEECEIKRGLHLVAQLREWPAWQPSNAVSRVRSVPADMAGGPGNPLGARALDLDSAPDRIHGTNAPSTIGRDMQFGCVRLANDDIIDLYKRVAVGSRVLITN